MDNIQTSNVHIEQLDYYGHQIIVVMMKISEGLTIAHLEILNRYTETWISPSDTIDLNEIDQALEYLTGMVDEYANIDLVA